MGNAFLYQTGGTKIEGTKDNNSLNLIETGQFGYYTPIGATQTVYAPPISMSHAMYIPNYNVNLIVGMSGNNPAICFARYNSSNKSITFTSAVSITQINSAIYTINIPHNNSILIGDKYAVLMYEPIINRTSSNSPDLTNYSYLVVVDCSQQNPVITSVTQFGTELSGNNFSSINISTINSTDFLYKGYAVEYNEGYIDRREIIYNRVYRLRISATGQISTVFSTAISLAEDYATAIMECISSTQGFSQYSRGSIYYQVIFTISNTGISFGNSYEAPGSQFLQPSKSFILNNNVRYVLGTRGVGMIREGGQVVRINGSQLQISNAYAVRSFNPYIVLNGNNCDIYNFGVVEGNVVDTSLNTEYINKISFNTANFNYPTTADAVFKTVSTLIPIRKNNITNEINDEHALVFNEAFYTWANLTYEDTPSTTANFGFWASAEKNVTVPIFNRYFLSYEGIALATGPNSAVYQLIN